MHGGRQRCHAWKEAQELLLDELSSRYARNDELGIPYACTIDFTSLEVMRSMRNCLEKLLGLHGDPAGT